MEHCEPVWCVASGPSSRCCFLIAIRCPSAHLLVCLLLISLCVHLPVWPSPCLLTPPFCMHILVSISLLCIGVSLSTLHYALHSILHYSLHNHQCIINNCWRTTAMWAVCGHFLTLLNHFENRTFIGLKFPRYMRVFRILLYVHQYWGSSLYFIWSPNQFLNIDSPC